ncbi:MAG: NADH-quinone oxidoreductase subunit NuoN [Gammaproteobacteria bacterium]|jgi:NADH-quinone oxidoreductase subunit N|nr:NADH-quinone oxidoreductase subunit NuoN [Gammaproteobacteria bacterium]MBT3488345.1 NADH-quinone oxidoreductase subunit NuoN [Gammaproteobacteria bacterium]MBT3719464.1 NADH-quinone oxidoreductase subunit NuoN [Gammaproteobacteria bacterium]MBT3845621.1 NADH-quinone oxidoreductase subunit NuoN [Gammaproteobacteria bacterium]MBT3894151.1 NADH-quinone oxidoreductase subunit NuoN [Gammaproteobacteria bacterium]
MKFDTSQLSAVAPEITLLTLACAVLLVDLFVKEESRIITGLLTMGSLLVTAVVVAAGMSGETQLLFDGSIVRDPMGDVLKIAVLLITTMVFLYSGDYQKDRELYRGEYFVLGLFGVLGMMILISAHSFLTLYLGLELMSLSMYVMVALQRDEARASEAAMKYFVLGALASGMLLYGISMLYGATGSLDIGEVAIAIQSQSSNADLNLVLVFGLVFVVSGTAFKLGAVPFHMWVPDVYQGAPTSVTTYIASAPKIAAFAMVMRLLVDGLNGMILDWQPMLIILALLSMALGNVIAIAQTNLKRMLAYSGISHIGFLLLGVLSGTEAGYESAMFYAITYALTSAGGFGMILLMSRKGFEAEEISDYKGLAKRHPWYALMMLILMFSMAGVPPTVGFYAKLAVLQQVVSVDLVWLAVAAVFFSVIGAFYYLRVIKTIYFDKAEGEGMSVENVDLNPVGITLSLNAMVVLALGLFPAQLMLICQSAIG